MSTPASESNPATGIPHPTLQAAYIIIGNELVAMISTYEETLDRLGALAEQATLAKLEALAEQIQGCAAADLGERCAHLRRIRPDGRLPGLFQSLYELEKKIDIKIEEAKCMETLLIESGELCLSRSTAAYTGSGM